MKQYKYTGILLLLILYALLMPVRVSESEGSGILGQFLGMIPFMDKLVHISMFGFLSCVNYLEQRESTRMVFWLVGLMGFAVLTEILQKLTGYRSFEYWDILADWIGICFGIGFGKLCRRFWRRKD